MSISRLGGKLFVAILLLIQLPAFAQEEKITQKYIDEVKKFNVDKGVYKTLKDMDWLTIAELTRIKAHAKEEREKFAPKSKSKPKRNTDWLGNHFALLPIQGDPRQQFVLEFGLKGHRPCGLEHSVDGIWNSGDSYQQGDVTLCGAGNRWYTVSLNIPETQDEYP